MKFASGILIRGDGDDTPANARPRMTRLVPPDLEKSAEGMIANFGKLAETQAGLIAHKLGLRKDWEGHATWLAIAKVIAEKRSKRSVEIRGPV